jgi:hypothetical protein
MNDALEYLVDYYLDADGKFIFTAHYLKRRGHCCENGCRHCPYGFTKMPPEEETKDSGGQYE